MIYLRFFIAAISVTLFLPASAVSSIATTDVVCTKYASSNGSDSNPGTEASPYRTAQYLVTHIASGETGCISGTFNEGVTISTAGVTLASTPGQRAKVNGGIRLNVTANDVTVRDIDLDGYGFPYSTFRIIGADRASVLNMDITNRNYPNGTSNSGAICLLAGAGATFETDPTYTVWGLNIERNRIHNCGDDAHEHSIYLETTRGAIVRDNFLYGNYGYGISMYPDAQGSLIEYNVIDRNSRASRANITFSGEAPGGEYSQPHGSDNNTVRYNIISNAVTRYNVDSYYPNGSILPTNNLVYSNCVWNAPFGNFGGTEGYSQTDNLNVDPLYVDGANGNYVLQTGSPCAGWGPRTDPTPPAPPGPDFSLSALPTSQVVVRGKSTTYNLTLTPSGGFAGSAVLSAKGLPSSTAASFNPTSISSTSVMTVTTGSHTRIGTYALTVTASGSGITHSTSVTLQVRRK